MSDTDDPPFKKLKYVPDADLIVGLYALSDNIKNLARGYAAGYIDTVPELLEALARLAHSAKVKGGKL